MKAKEIGIIIDNWAMHRSDKVKRFWRGIGVRLYYLPPYCLELAPIEVYFSQIKARLIKTIDGKESDLRVDAFVNKITKCIQSISKESILKLWYSFFWAVQGNSTKSELILMLKRFKFYNIISHSFALWEYTIIK